MNKVDSVATATAARLRTSRINEKLKELEFCVRRKVDPKDVLLELDKLRSGGTLI